MRIDDDDDSLVFQKDTRSFLCSHGCVSFTGTSTTTPGTPVHVSEVWNPVRLIVILLHRNAALAWTDVITFLQKCLKYQFAEWVLFKINGFDNFLLGEFVFYK